MRTIVRLIQRLMIIALGVFSIWLIVDVFKFVDHRAPPILALSLTYAIAAYVILPRAVRAGLKILQRNHVPRFTVTGDGLPGDTINLALVGTLDQLRGAFAKAGWIEAEPLTLASSWHMARAFVLNRPYPAAPFSTLYLFGRGQDIGFQRAIGDSPRKRHHVRFWAQNDASAHANTNARDAQLNAAGEQDHQRVLWVGAGTRDTGFSLTWLTFQLTHATDSDTNAERDFVINELTRCGSIRHATFFKPGDNLERVNHYITDGEIAVAELAITSSNPREHRPQQATDGPPVDQK
ncbi:hypothetical protein HYPDE_29803 [Hyphomicrobium denitrificans 1NES1]|uniref:LssY-like C-terminal domain-containing protein n=1 Tax=Hyphomicrobium denitrificans 1NES1 TaxID=670307 RepID=N0BBX8_9HYPH|nr:LssY C-terminal domain-containing protein [Hyphomicrobium denitrificans]AGK57635.1 hypothetical protein HYPDE_29803 [Hyphomicrobium denitrificans 1NES1]